MRILVTGGSGFIGSHLVDTLGDAGHDVVNLDRDEPRAEAPGSFAQVDIRHLDEVHDIVAEWQPDVVAHLAAETHVDRSIEGPESFVTTNVVGTFNMLTATHRVSERAAVPIKFVHVSTDEVFGSIDKGAFTPDSPYLPRSPYAASKAAADHLVRAWGTTYRLPIVVTNTSNNYGARQHPEKLIPHMIARAVRELPLPLYGDGTQVRDWIHVSDHTRALQLIIESNATDTTYLIGARCERTNLMVVQTVCRALDRFLPRQAGTYEDLITFVPDRPGHDQRYAIDPSLTESELGWVAQAQFETAIEATVRWYIDHSDWTEHIIESGYSLRRVGRSQQ